MPGLPSGGKRIRDTFGDRPFLDSKLISSKLPTAHVLRPRLVSRLEQGIKTSPLTLISALAGSGKSVLAASWAATSTNWPVAWLALDRSDNQPEQFWSYVFEAMSRCGIVPAHASRGEVIDETFLAWLCSDLLNQPDPVVLVLDHADWLVSPQILHSLDFMVTHAASHFRLLMCSRADPLLPLSRYRLSELLTEIRGSELSFTSSEATLLLEKHSLTVSAEFADRLIARTRGWPAALGLAAIALDGSPDGQHLLSSLDVSDVSTAEYLMTEVLDAQTPELRTVLLRTSVADELWPDLVNELVGHPGGLKILSAFRHANVFVEETAGATRSRRVHPLLREMLQAQLSYESPDLYAQLHKRCAAWMCAAGQLTAAVEHAVTSGDYLYAVEMLVDELAVCSIMVMGDALPYVQALRSMPVALPGASAPLIQAAIALARGEVATSWQHLTRADANAGPATSAQTLSAAMVRATLYAESGDVEQSMLACTEIDALLTPELEEAHPELLAQLAACRGTAELWRGDIESAEPALTQAADLAAACGASLLRAQSLGRLALLYALWGRYRRAERVGDEAHRLALQSGVSARRYPPAAAIALAWSFTQQNRDAQAQHWLNRATESLIENQRQILAPVATVLRSTLAARADSVVATDKAIDDSTPIDDQPTPITWMRELIAVQSVDVSLAGGHTDLAKGALAAFAAANSPRIQLSLNRIQAAAGAAPAPPSDALDGADIPLDLQVDAWLAQCSFQLDHGRESSAVHALERALRLAGPEHLRRPFVHPPPRIRDLMRRRVPDEAIGWLRCPRRAGESQVAARHADGPGGPVVLTQQLSTRETEVLRQLAQMLSTEEIGLTLFVSVNTVRTHIRSILRKLDVPGRNAAVRRGWELGLIPRAD